MSELKSKVEHAEGRFENDGPAVLCFSHLRWNFVYQRPQHLMSRFQSRARVFFFEEPVFVEDSSAQLKIDRQSDGLTVLTPLLPRGVDAAFAVNAQRDLIDNFIAQKNIEDFIAWYYTPMALKFTSHLRPDVTVYDCMDELSAFDGAPPELTEYERELFSRADLVFAGGRSLYEAKRRQNDNVHLFASSIDRDHFAVSRVAQKDPADQQDIPHPRVGFFGVLDERLDRELLREVAESKPEWHFVLIGPVVKINEEELPRANNIHYLGSKHYADLPQYLASWDVAMLPFAMNASTRFISPTKTPEYLAAGKPVVSTPIPDVVEPYGRLGLAEIASNALEFSAAIEHLLVPRSADWLKDVDKFLSRSSWDLTFQQMWQKIDQCRASSFNDAPTLSEQWRESINV